MPDQSQRQAQPRSAALLPDTVLAVSLMCRHGNQKRRSWPGTSSTIASPWTRHQMLEGCLDDGPHHCGCYCIICTSTVQAAVNVSFVKAGWLDHLPQQHVQGGFGSRRGPGGALHEGRQGRVARPLRS